MAAGLTAEEFERALREDLPRGRAPRKGAVGPERGQYVHWLEPGAMRATPANGEVWEGKGGLLLGRRDGRVIGWKDDRHVLTIAGSRAGKGVSLLVPNLIFYEGSALVVDPKGDLARYTARRRAAGVPGGKGGLRQDVHVLDPFGVSGQPSASFNPLATMDIEDDDVLDDVALISEALIEHPERADRYWTDSAQQVLTAIIVFVLGECKTKDRDECNLATVRDLLSLTHIWVTSRLALLTARGEKSATREGALLDLLAKAGAPDSGNPFGHICLAIAEQLRGMADKERASVLSVSRTQTRWLDSKKIRAVLRDDEVRLEHLKRAPGEKRTTIYLSLPSSRLGTYARWLRLVIMLGISAMERATVKASPPVLFVLDEFAVLGHVDVIEKAAGLMAGYDLKLWMIVQNVGQLKQHYSAAWETFFANCGVVTAFGVGDFETLKALSDMLGNLRVSLQVSGGVAPTAVRQAASDMQEDRQIEPLLAPHELRVAFGRKKKRLLVFNVEDLPAVVERFIYHVKAGEDFELFGGLYDPDPKFA